MQKESWRTTTECEWR